MAIFHSKLLNYQSPSGKKKKHRWISLEMTSEAQTSAMLLPTLGKLREFMGCAMGFYAVMAMATSYSW